MQIDCKKVLIIALFTILLLGLGTLSLLAADQPKNVLILNSYHQGLAWTDGQTEAIIAKMPNYWEQQRFIEYLDWKRYPTSENLQRQYEYLKAKYAHQKIDLLITTDDAALQFALEHREELFSDAPIVFSGVFKSKAIDLLQGKDRVTGVYEALDSEGTIRLALKINPQVRNIYVFHDTTESGEASGEDVISAVNGLNALKDNEEDKIKVFCLSDLSFKEITDKVSILGNDSIVIIGSYNMDKTGIILAPELFAAQVSAHSTVPVYSLYEFLLGSGITGGSMLSAYIHGERAAELGLKILQGEDIAQLPAVEAENIVTAFDYNKLIRFAIPEKALPEGSVLINKPFSVLEAYRPQITKALTIFFTLIGLVIILLLNISKRKENEKLLRNQKEELTAVYEELTASEEELRQQFNEIVAHEQALRQSEERFKLAMEATRDTIWEWDLASGLRSYSGHTYEMLGYRGEELAKFSDWQVLIHPNDWKLVQRNLAAHLSRKSEIYSCEYRLRCKEGQYKWIRANGKALFDCSGKPYKIVGSHRDITDLKEQEQKMVHLAYHDFLTDLPNQAMIKEIMEEEIEKAHQTETCHGLLFLDIDNFKVINDSFGHSIGDQLLVVISRYLQEILGTAHVVAKFGGDEFIVLLRDLASKHQAEEYAEQLINLFEKAVIVENFVCYVSASIGIVYYPEDGTNFEELFKNADTAMYQAKQHGKKKYVIFDQKMNDAVVEKVKIQNNLQQAIEKQEFFLNYQPQVELDAGKVVGFEALIRWQKESELIPPSKFIPIAEETGQIIPLGEWVLKTACIFMKKIHDIGYEELSISVNISSVQLRQKDFVDNVLEIIEQTGLSPNKLVLEITETVLIEFLDPHILATLDLLQGKGIAISLDDFGQGYSSLNYIRLLPISTIKIDKSFIADIGQDDSENIAGAIIVLAHRLGLRVVAEGVEVPEQLNYLKGYHCDEVQGYLISKPLPAEDVLKLLEDFREGKQKLI